MADPKRQCKCNPLQVERYIGRISGPLLDRLDIHIEVPSVPFRQLSDQSTGTNSEEMKTDVYAAREMQQRRFGKSSLRLNGRMTPPGLHALAFTSLVVVQCQDRHRKRSTRGATILESSTRSCSSRLQLRGVWGRGISIDRPIGSQLF
jgi:predicted ATPase with chaperone activity